MTTNNTCDNPLKIMNIVRQAAHDIRSPLEALTIIIKCCEKKLNRDEMAIIVSAMDRIKIIANDILEDHRHKKNNLNLKHVSITDVAKTVEDIVAEKKMQYMETPQIHILADTYAAQCKSMRHRGIKVDLDTFARTLSNIINNAIEAVEGDGRVLITFHTQGNHALLCVADNGKGIDPSILPLLMQEGATFKKDHGNGLGLYHARQAVTSWGGLIKIESNAGRGTVVHMQIPTIARCW
ncbi:MAG: HAMP domain-containing histidine kinase [Deltaproteobacteria bacterium]|nr:HAMP domain-containing histidine kinase [Deltaproteobacteria bacterium]